MTLSDTARDVLVDLYGELPTLPLERGEWDKARRAIAERLFDTKLPDNVALGEFLEGQVAYDKSNRINEVLIEMTGIGEDGFTVTSLSYPTMDIEEDTTFLAYDMAMYHEQEKAVSGIKDHEPEPYRVSLYGHWCRWVEDSGIVYGFLYGAAPYMSELAEDWLYEILDAVSPSAPIPFPFLSSPEEFATEMQRRTQTPTAAEKTRDALLGIGSRLMAEIDRSGIWNDIFEKEEAWAAVRREDLGTEIRKHVVFSNSKALSHVRYGHFSGDLTALPDGSEALASKIAEIKADFIARFKEAAAKAGHEVTIAL